MVGGQWGSSTNVFLLPCVVNRQLPHLIKQADVAVFASRCEGGTNLMAMETLACGVTHPD